jgi:hypothetical protein
MTNISLITSSATLLFQNDFTGSINLTSSGSLNYNAVNHLFNSNVSASTLTSTNVTIGTALNTVYPLFISRVGGGGSVGITINNIGAASTRDVISTIIPYSSSDQGGYLFNTHNGAIGDINALYIQPNGNIILGSTTSSFNKLQVNGNVNATSLTGSVLGTSSYANALNANNSYTVSGLGIKTLSSNSKCGSVTMFNGTGSITSSAYTATSVMFFSLQTLTSASIGTMPRVSNYNTSSVTVNTIVPDGSTYKWMIIDFV